MQNSLNPKMGNQDVLIGGIWALGAAATHSLVAIAVRLLDHLPAIELVFFRNALGLMIFLSIVSWRGFWFIQTKRIGVHLVRNFANFFGMWLWFAGLALLPLAKAIALHFTVPLIVVVLAVIFLKERPGPVRLVCTIIGFFGVLIILRPGLVPISAAAFLVLGSAISYAAVAIFTRSLGFTEHPTTTTFYYQSTLTIISGLSILLVSLISTANPDLETNLEWFNWEKPLAKDIPVLVLLAVTGTVAPYCMIRAYVHAEATIVQPIEYLRLPLTALIAYWVFSQTTDLWVWMGAFIIVGSTLYLTQHETKKKKLKN